MPSSWTQESVLRLAPDAASAKAGRDLGAARKWAAFNANEQTLWGLCQGSGSKPYQTIVDLTEPAFKCSCPSRKFPCKHGLGLLLMYAGDQASFAKAEPPAWVGEWLTSRAARATKKADTAAKPVAPVDVAAQAERREKRLEKIVDGLSSLRTWLDDLVRQGVASVPSRGAAFFDEPARRMVDAQAPGVARMLRDLSATTATGAGWHAAFLRQLASLHGLLRAAENLKSLPGDLREDLMAAIGVPVPQEEVLARPATADTWQILSQDVDFEERLRVQRTWLFGVENRRPALVLHFAHGTGPLDASFVMGTQFAGELCYFPGSGVRVVVKSRQPGPNFERAAGCETFDALCDLYSRLLAAQPWLGPVVLPVLDVRPLYRDERWQLIDASGKSLPARASAAVGWRLMAASGGHPMDVAVRFDGDAVEPVAVVDEGQYISVAPSFTGGAELAG